MVILAYNLKIKAMMKFKEIDARQVAGKIGWEMEACFDLERAATNSEGRLILTRNNGILDKPGYKAKGTYEVGIVNDATGDFSLEEGLTKKEAVRIFESYLE